jgi:serine/threonine-protein kinase
MTDGDALDPRIGRVLDGKYRLDELVGEGGLGKVYRAAHLDLGGAVAVKFLGATTPGRESRERFRREARALAKLRHPAIVSVLDFGEEEGELYLVMELVVGPRLADCILVDGTPMPFRRIVDLTRQILGVLEATHAAGVVHRDLKPDNVMLAAAGDRADHVKVLDFGIALVVEDPEAPRLTETQGVQGTPHYMAPEQCRGRDVGPPADVYAMGAVLYEMLAGEPPFDARSAVELMTKHLYVAPSPVVERGVGRTVPAELEQLAMRALAKRAEDRPTARDMLDELDRFEQGTSAVATGLRAAEERVRAVGLSRSQRGLPAGAPGPRGTDDAPEAAAEETWVDAWGFSDERASDLESALALQKIAVRRWKGDEPPPHRSRKGTPVRAVLLVADGLTDARLRRLRARADGGEVPVLVADAQPERTAALVRAGASDVALSIVGDDVLGAKLRRLIRRGR